MAMAKKQNEYIPQKPHANVHHTSCHTLYKLYIIYIVDEQIWYKVYIYIYINSRAINCELELQPTSSGEVQPHQNI